MVSAELTQYYFPKPNDDWSKRLICILLNHIKSDLFMDGNKPIGFASFQKDNRPEEGHSASNVCSFREDLNSEDMKSLGITPPPDFQQYPFSCLIRTYICSEISTVLGTPKHIICVDVLIQKVRTNLTFIDQHGNPEEIRMVLDISWAYVGPRSHLDETQIKDTVREVLRAFDVNGGRVDKAPLDMGFGPLTIGIY